MTTDTLQPLYNIPVINVATLTQPQIAPYADVRLIVFDVDGTLTKTKSGARFAREAADRLPLPLRETACTHLWQMGMAMAVATNQGGCAYQRNQMDPLTYRGQLSKICEQWFHIPGAHFFLCPHHVNGDVPGLAFACECRKPQPGMLRAAQQVCVPGVTMREMLYVGDRQEDEEAAKRAGCRFAWAEDFFAHWEGYRACEEE